MKRSGLFLSSHEYIRENYVYFIVPAVFHAHLFSSPSPLLLPSPPEGEKRGTIRGYEGRFLAMQNRIQRKWKFIVRASRLARNNILPVSGGFPSSLSLLPRRSPLLEGGWKGVGAPSLISVRGVIIFEWNSVCIAQLFEPIR